MPGSIKPSSLSFAKGQTLGAPWKYVPMPWPMKRGHTRRPAASATSSIFEPTTRKSTPGPQAPMPAHVASRAARHMARPTSSGVPAMNIELVSPWHPPMKTVTSTLRMSPSSSARSSGMPCAITSFTLVLTLFWKPMYPNGLGYAPRATTNSCTAASTSSVVAPTATARPPTSKASRAKAPATCMRSTFSGDLISGVSMYGCHGMLTPSSQGLPSSLNVT
mmetsp:Transcript_99347/g.318786  ORF Transcript_99347/g.318786 Transcript_99347/m.318786 type:complete len:220 (+) Transcript_99347:345-1004(+)